MPTTYPPSMIKSFGDKTPLSSKNDENSFKMP